MNYKEIKQILNYAFPDADEPCLGDNTPSCDCDNCTDKFKLKIVESYIENLEKENRKIMDILRPFKSRR